MLLIPVSGILGSMLKGYNIMFFGTKLPNYLPLNKTLGGSIFKIHKIAPYIFAGFIVLHLAAFLKHQLIDKIGIFSRITWNK